MKLKFGVLTLPLGTAVPSADLEGFKETNDFWAWIDTNACAVY